MFQLQIVTLAGAAPGTKAAELELSEELESVALISCSGLVASEEDNNSIHKRTMRGTVSKKSLN